MPKLYAMRLPDNDQQVPARDHAHATKRVTETNKANPGARKPAEVVIWSGSPEQHAKQLTR